MWQGASAQKIAATRGYGATVDLEADGPADAFDRLARADRETGRDARPSVRRPGRGRRRRHRRARDRGGRPRRRRRHRRGRRRRPDLRHPGGDRRPHAHDRRRARDEPGAPRRDRRRRARPGRAALDRRRPERAVCRRSPARALPRSRARPRHRGRRSKTPSASSTSGRSSRASRPERPPLRRCSRARCRPNDRSSSSVAATFWPKRPLLSWPGDEGRHPSRVRPLDRALLVREHVRDPLDEARAARRDLRAVPPVLHGQAEARRHGRPRRALPAAAREGRPRRPPWRSATRTDS